MKFDDLLARMEAKLASASAVARENLVMAAIVQEIIAAQPKDWRNSKKRAAIIVREIAACAKELRKRGVRNPIAQAEKEVAERWHYASGAALNRWLRRNR